MIHKTIRDYINLKARTFLNVLIEQSNIVIVWKKLWYYLQFVRVMVLGKHTRRDVKYRCNFLARKTSMDHACTYSMGNNFNGRQQFVYDYPIS